MRPPRKQDNRKPPTLPQMSLPGAPYLTLEMWMLQPSQREPSIALPQLEIPHSSPLFAESSEGQFTPPETRQHHGQQSAHQVSSYK
jgi:hypothetical protein